MIIKRPTRLIIFATAVTAFNALIAVSIGSLALACGFVVLLIALSLIYRDARLRPIAELSTGVLHLQSRSLSVSVEADSIQRWQRIEKSLTVQLADRGEIGVGPFLTEAPVRELERGLADAFPEKR